jgi:superfamily II RNA helicase
MSRYVGSCWAIHTRDYRIHNPQNCQILVTVPEMLAIMLLSPPLAKVWTPRVK